MQRPLKTALSHSNLVINECTRTQSLSAGLSCQMKKLIDFSKSKIKKFPIPIFMMRLDIVVADAYTVFVFRFES
jgi:hypothetical protein